MNRRKRRVGKPNPWRRIYRFMRIGLPIAFMLAGAGLAQAIVTDLNRLDRIADRAFTAPMTQAEINEIVANEPHDVAFEEIFEAGDVFFDTDFNALDGGGANLGNGQRFTRVPRADLRGAGQWFNHTPARITGPNAAACTDCHREPGDGAGPNGSNVHRDPLRNGNMSQFIQRNTPHLFGGAGVQVLAEEMTEALHTLRETARQQACSRGSFRQTLSAKGLNFGVIVANRTQQSPCQVNFDTSAVTGVSSDLVIRPFQWKGTVATVRDFVVDASHNELGIQAVEIVGANVDGDFDGVANEASIGDMTALAVYIAAQPRPTSLLELNSLGLLDEPLSAAQIAAINRGSTQFTQSGCASCHVPTLLVNDPVFHEPSQNPNYRRAVFQAGQNAVAEGVDPARPVSFDFSVDLFDNPFPIPGGTTLGNFRKNSQGQTMIELFGDLRRHNMGAGLAESIADEGIQNSTFMTENLWGVGTTAPYLHDGRATTLAEAILEHGGEGQDSANAFRSRVDAASGSDTRAADLLAFLENLVLFFPPEEE